MLPPKNGNCGAYCTGGGESSAIEHLVVDNGVVTPAHLDARRAAWHRAAHATPHGRPIPLENNPTPHSSGE